MSERPGPGLRERKKQRTRQAIAAAAIALFQESGFDRVSVAEVAAAAEVSKPTLFAYFPSKEDLVLHRFADHVDESARVVRAHPGVPPLAALRRHFLDGLDRRDPITGLNDVPDVLEFQRLLYGTPALMARMPAYMLNGEEALAQALAEGAGPAGPAVPEGSARFGGFAARVAAAQIIAAHRVLATRNSEEMMAGRSADEVHPDAVARAALAFDLLEDGIVGRSAARPGS